MCRPLPSLYMQYIAPDSSAVVGDRRYHKLHRNEYKSQVGSFFNIRLNSVKII